MSDAKVKFYGASYKQCDQEHATRFGFECPKGRGRCTGLLIAGRTNLKRDPQNKNGGAAMWDMTDATAGKETFSPSINCTGCWHGYIRGGRCVDASGRDEPEPVKKGT